MKKDLKREYIKLRLEDWGIWERTEHSFNNLNYRSFMGKLIQDSTSIKSLTLCDFECEQVSIIMSSLKQSNFRLYEVALLFFVKDINPKDIAKQRKTSTQAVYDALNRLYSIVDKEIEIIENIQDLRVYNCSNYKC